MLIPEACPVCATNSLEPVMRKPLNSGTETLPQTVSGILAYRCSNGHMFIVMDEEPKAKKKGAGD